MTQTADTNAATAADSLTADPHWQDNLVAHARGNRAAAFLLSLHQDNATRENTERWLAGLPR